MPNDVSQQQSVSLTVDQALQQAIARHQAGQLQDAERLYRAILQVHPNHPDANHNLGVLAVKMNQPVAGLPHFKAALEANPNQGQYWLSYIEALILSGQTSVARQMLEEGCQRGLQGVAVEALAERLEDGVRILGKSTAQDPQTPKESAPATLAIPQNNKAKTKHTKLTKSARKPVPYRETSPDPREISTLVALFTKGRYKEAATLAEDMTASFPLHGFGWKVLGLVLMRMGRILEALIPMQKAVVLLPKDAEAHNNLGNALSHLGQLDDAVASYRQALKVKPDYAEAYSNLGSALRDLGKLDEAVANYRHALKIKPDIAAAHSNLGSALRDLGKLDEAVASYRQALKNKPDYAEAHSNLGNALEGLGQLDAAVASYRQALKIKPDYAEAYSNLGNALGNLGQLDAAVASYRQALKIKPDYDAAYSNLLFVLNYHADKSPEEIFASYREYNERFGLPCRSEWREHNNSKNIRRRIKVGYVSPDFRKHACQYFLEPLLARHDKEAVEVYAYAELSLEDAVTKRYKGYVEHWLPTRGISDTALAERIRADGIDILVDLAGHTAHNRLSVFARKPAPVSVSWLGFGYTTGLQAVDYFLTDEASAPPGSEGLFSEVPWRLVTPGYAYRPAEGMGSVSLLPATERGHVTFGTLSRAVRINHRTIRVWAEILKRVEGARLVIDSLNFQDAAAQKALADRFAAHGIGRERLEIGYSSPPWDILRGMDIGLDCFPHNSGTTLLESLYMGVPFVTLAGRPSVGRLGSSILEGAGHPEWIARSEEEYVEKAVALASDLPKLAALRGGLRSEMETSPLMDEAGFTRKVEAAYRAMWAKWCENNP